MKISKAWYVLIIILINQGFPLVAMAMDQDAIIRRLDALEKENNVLKQRLSRIEHAPIPSKNHELRQISDKSRENQSGAKSASAFNIDPILDIPAALQAASNTFSHENPNTSAYA